MSYKLTASIITAVLMSLGAPRVGYARPPLPDEVTVEITSDSGSVFQSIRYRDDVNNGTRIVKKYLEAKRGENFGIMIRNNAPERIGVVIAVDGRNILSGKKSDLKSFENMYIVNPYDQARYDGWRTTNNEVHRFYFTEPDDSYSVRTFSDSSAMGVIAVAVYREKERPLPMQGVTRGKGAPAAPSLNSAARGAEQSLADEAAGTGFGEAQYSPVISVDFEPERAPIQKTLVKYEWHDTLCKKGIIRCRPEKRNRLWDEDGYSPFPPGYPRS